MNFQEGAYIYINKPYRMSSFGALAHIRYVLSKRLHVKRVKMGHAGTLDPLAIGFVAAFLSGCFACKLMINLVKKGKLVYFGIYCAIIGIAVLTYQLTR